MDFVPVLLGREDNFEFSAVTDSKLRFRERSLGAASPRVDTQDFQRVIADRFYPEHMGDLGILRGKPEVKFRFRDEHFRYGESSRGKEGHEHDYKECNKYCPFH
jgi:hypothetical protein